MATQTVQELMDDKATGSPAAVSFESMNDAVTHFLDQFDKGMPAEEAFWGVCQEFLKIDKDQRIKNIPALMFIVSEIMDAAKERIARKAADVLGDYDAKNITLQKAKDMMSKLASSKKELNLPAEPPFDDQPAKDLSNMLGYLAFLIQTLRRDLPEEDAYWKTQDDEPLNCINFAGLLVNVIRPTIIDLAHFASMMLDGGPVDKKALHDKLNVLMRDFVVISGIARSTSKYKSRIKNKGSKDNPLESPAEIFACLHDRILAGRAGRKHLVYFRRVAARMQKAMDRIELDAFNIIFDRQVTGQELAAIKAATLMDDASKMKTLEATGLNREEMSAVIGKSLPEPAAQQVEQEEAPLQQKMLSAALTALEEEAMAEQAERQILQDISDDSCPTLEDLVRTRVCYVYAGKDKKYQEAAIRAIRYVLRKPEQFEISYAENNWICGICVQAAKRPALPLEDDPTAKFPEAQKAFDKYRTEQDMTKLQARLRDQFGDGGSIPGFAL